MDFNLVMYSSIIRVINVNATLDPIIVTSSKIKGNLQLHMMFVGVKIMEISCCVLAASVISTDE